jgi:hypothetical protein
MVISVAFVTAQRSVADCPRSIVEGSAVKLPMEGFAGGGGGAGASFGGGGGGGGGVFFLHPVTTSNKVSAMSRAHIFFLFILNFCLLVSLNQTIKTICCSIRIWRTAVSVT